MEENSWDDLNLSPWLKKACHELQLKTPTPIQYHCIPSILDGKDVIGSAPTGSGKTGAFALPILHKLSQDMFGIFCLVLTPTRELAYQIADQFSALGAPIHIRVNVIVGGKNMVNQSSGLNSQPHIVIATPGRLLDHLTSGSTINFKKIKFLVLDEADRLLSGESLSKEIESIVPYCSKNHQTLLFSATMPPEIENSSFLNLKDPFKWFSVPQVNTVDTLEQKYIFIPEKVKNCYLVYLIRCEEENDQKMEREEEELRLVGYTTSSELRKNRIKSSIIIFTPTCHLAQLLHETFKQLGISSVPLHSQLSQSRRLSSLQRFRSGYVKVLIATDVASRGLDIPTVDLVIHYNIPLLTEDYIHRVGRTARIGRVGKSLLFVTQYDIERILNIEKDLGKKLEEYKIDEDLALRHLNETATALTYSKLKLEQDGFAEKTKKKKRKNMKKKE